MSTIFFGGFIPVLIYADAMRRRIQCTNCGHIFRQPTKPSTGIATLSKWIVIPTFITICMAGYLIFSPDILAAIPDSTWLLSATQFIEDHPKVIAVTVLPLSLIIVLMISTASTVSIMRANKELKEYFRVTPPHISTLKNNLNTSPEESPKRASSLPIPPKEDPR